MALTRKEFIEKYGDYIHKVTKGTGILAGTLAAQAIIESQGKVGSKYYVGASRLAKESNNYFGIKCHGWSGGKYHINTSEGSDICFRKYGSVKDSIDDYVRFLQENKRYERAGVFKAKTVREQAEALKRAGYDTSGGYANLIVGVYEDIRDYLEEAKKKTSKSEIIIGSVMLVAAITGVIILIRSRKK